MVLQPLKSFCVWVVMKSLFVIDSNFPDFFCNKCIFYIFMYIFISNVPCGIKNICQYIDLKSLYVLDLRFRDEHHISIPDWCIDSFESLPISHQSCQYLCWSSVIFFIIYLFHERFAFASISHKTVLPFSISLLFLKLMCVDFVSFNCIFHLFVHFSSLLQSFSGLSVNISVFLPTDRTVASSAKVVLSEFSKFRISQVYNTYRIGPRMLLWGTSALTSFSWVWFWRSAQKCKRSGVLPTIPTVLYSLCIKPSCQTLPNNCATSSHSVENISFSSKTMPIMSTTLWTWSTVEFFSQSKIESLELSCFFKSWL